MQDLAINLVASVLAATAAWALQRILAYRRLARMRAFYGLAKDATVLLVVGRHASSNRPHSMHRDDVAALVEIATIVRECGARADLVPAADASAGLGKTTEFCVGGPTTNPRMAAHLRAALPGVAFSSWNESGSRLTLTVGPVEYERERDQVDYVVLARTGGYGRPVFLVAGQTAIGNRAAARYLANNYRDLERRYGREEQFCLLLRILERAAFGPDLVELVGDVTEAATKRRPMDGAQRQVAR